MSLNSGSPVRMSKYHIPPINLESERYRTFCRSQEIADACSKTMRWALHLSPDELAGLERLNPDTLGHDDQRLRDKYWADFCTDPASIPFRVQRAI